METFYSYLLKSTVSMVLFYAFYRLVIFQNTFFKVRRFTLLAIIFFSVIYPLIDIVDWLSRKEPIHEILNPYLLENTALTITPQIKESVSPEQIGMTFYGIGVCLLLLRMLIQLYSIIRLRKKATIQLFHEQKIYVLPNATPPFSFFRWIFMDPKISTTADAEQVFTHEMTHYRQCHSFDILIGEISSIFFWFNPFAWLLKQEIRVNLEHLADEKVLENGTEATVYQYSLLRLCHHVTSNKLVNNFNIHQFKRRIMMMNKNKSNRHSLLRYAFLIPVAGVLILSGNAQAVINKVKQEGTAIASNNQIKSFVAQGQVIDENKQPLPGVSVIIKNTNRGTITDSKGYFKLPMDAGEELVFSYVGKNTALLMPTLAQSKDLIIALHDQPIKNEEVVVVGYDLQKGEKITTQQPVDQKPEKEENDEVFTVVEDMPQFPGGDQALMQFIAKNIKYPHDSQAKRVQGRVIVTYVIGVDGKIHNAEVVKSVDPGLDKEALRIVNSMPAWKPGKQRGKAIAVRYTLPITFRLQ